MPLTNSSVVSMTRLDMRMPYSARRSTPRCRNVPWSSAARRPGMALAISPSRMLAAVIDVCRCIAPSNFVARSDGTPSFITFQASAAALAMWLVRPE